MERYKVSLGLPGTSFIFGTLQAIGQSSRDHDVTVDPACAVACNFNRLWANALNLFEVGEITHFAMIHADVTPEPYWLDKLIEEMDRLNASLVSAAVPIKDSRGLLSCGIGDLDDPWVPLRRVTMREAMKLPETFGAEDFGYPGEMLLHNNGCWVADLRYKEFFQTDSDGNLIPYFRFPERIRRDSNGRWGNVGESEDWYFSRMLHELGLRNTYVTRKVKLTHRGFVDYCNWEAWGQFENDENTAHKWAEGVAGASR